MFVYVKAAAVYREIPTDFLYFFYIDPVCVCYGE